MNIQVAIITHQVLFFAMNRKETEFEKLHFLFLQNPKLPILLMIFVRKSYVSDKNFPHNKCKINSGLHFLAQLYQRWTFRSLFPFDNHSSTQSNMISKTFCKNVSLHLFSPVFVWRHCYFLHHTPGPIRTRSDSKGFPYQQRNRNVAA